MGESESKTLYGCYRTHHWAHWPEDDYSETGDTEKLLTTGTSVPEVRKKYNDLIRGKANNFRLKDDPILGDDETRIRHNGSTGGGFMHSSYTVEIRPLPT